MSRLVARAENWSKVYEAFNNINFAAFDYNTIKQSLLDYIKLYFPEGFNDYIESSEFIAIVECFAYIAELLSFRFDIDAHENFLPVAQRKDSILRLAKLISYTADRQLPARGLVKITSISTTENIIDAFGTNLANKTIKWNDINNQQWKDQFILIVNRIFNQNFGTVAPSERFQIENVLFELYDLNINPLSTGVIPYSAVVNSQSLPMELVPVEYSPREGIIERRPRSNSNFTMLYAQDGLGDISDTTGFFCYTKQGTLQRFRKNFDGVTPHQVFEIPLNDVNDTDVWINNVDPITGEIIDLPSPLLHHKRDISGISGEWIQVDLAHAQNVIFNTNPNRNKYEVETRDNNRVRILFGDGDFVDIPSGTFDFWVRTSIDQDIIVSQSSVIDVPATLTYMDLFGRVQTFSFTFSLINSLQNNSSSESIEHIRQTAPAVYYSQDRMVNGQDYNTFMLQDSSILKLRATNRTFVGDSRYNSWFDPSTTYENVKMFGQDGVIYFQEKVESTTASDISDINELIVLYIEPLLSSTDIFIHLTSYGVSPFKFRRVFNQSEKERLVEGLTPPPTPSNISLYYNLVLNEWFAVQMSDTPENVLDSYGWPINFINTPLITIVQTTENKYTINRLAKRLIFHSPTMKFWNTNSSAKIIDYTTLTSNYDEIVILQANSNHNRSGILQQNCRFNVLGLDTIESGTNIGLSDTSKLSILPFDENQDTIPDNVDINEDVNHLGLADIIKPKLLVDLLGVDIIPPLPVGIEVTLPIHFIIGQNDVHVENTNGTPVVLGTDWFEGPYVDDGTGISNVIRLVSPMFANSLVKVSVNDYVYFAKVFPEDNWSVAPTAPESLISYLVELSTGPGLWKREIGRSDLNFGWFHRSPRYHLIDPAPTNIIDVFIIQKGYFLSIKRWLEDSLAPTPVAPTPIDLRLAYSYLIDNRMISDTVVLHPGKIKLLFGQRAITSLQARFKVVRSSDSLITDNQIKTTIVTTIRNFFDISTWEFGETFYFTELSAAIHSALPTEISTILLVPTSSRNQFGDLFQIQAREDEVFYPDVTVNDIDVISDINATAIKMGQTITYQTSQPNIFVQSTSEYAYEYDQPILTISWTINHNLGYYPIIRVYNDIGQEIQPITVLHTGVLQAIVVFNTPTIGRARLM